MPAFSGLWDGVHGTSYAAMSKSTALPPHLRGIVRALMQRRASHGLVNAIGQAAPATISRVEADRSDVAVIGGMEAWPSRDPDAANEVTIANLGDELHGGAGTALETIARPTDAVAGSLTEIFDTTKRKGHPADSAQSGATANAVTASVAT